MDDTITRSWEKYIHKTMAYHVVESARRWYVRHAVLFIKVRYVRRLHHLEASDINTYLKRKVFYPFAGPTQTCCTLTNSRMPCGPSSRP